MIFFLPHQVLEIRLDSTCQSHHSQFPRYTCCDFYYYVPKDIIYSKELVFWLPARAGLRTKPLSCVNLRLWETLHANFLDSLSFSALLCSLYFCTTYCLTLALFTCYSDHVQPACKKEPTCVHIANKISDQ